MVAYNDQFFFNVAMEIARAYPLYIVKYATRNLWHALFDPGYATTRYNVQGYIYTGNDFIPAFRSWGTYFSADTVTQYGTRAAREMEYFPLKTRSSAVQDFFFSIENLWLQNFDKYVWITWV